MLALSDKQAEKKQNHPYIMIHEAHFNCHSAVKWFICTRLDFDDSIDIIRFHYFPRLIVAANEGRETLTETECILYKI